MTYIDQMTKTYRDATLRLTLARQAGDWQAANQAVRCIEGLRRDLVAECIKRLRERIRPLTTLELLQAMNGKATP